jgi:hypothetical protein
MYRLFLVLGVCFGRVSVWRGVKGLLYFRKYSDYADGTSEAVVTRGCLPLAGLGGLGRLVEARLLPRFLRVLNPLNCPCRFNRMANIG